MTSSWFFLSTLNYDARSTTNQIFRELKINTAVKIPPHNSCVIIIIIIIIIIIKHVPKSAETSQGGKVTILWNQLIQMTELSPTTNQTL